MARGSRFGARALARALALTHLRTARLTIAVAAVVSCRAAARPAESAPVGAEEWTAYGHDAGGSRYSPAAEITRDNVAALRVAWMYRTGDYAVGEGATRSEGTPIFVDGTLYVSTPFGRVIALDPSRGTERWSFDPRADLSGDYGDFANRGVATWLDPRAGSGAACRRRIFVAPIDARLIALDAATGAPCRDFGRDGQIDLSRDLVNPPAYKGEYEVTSPPAVVGDVVVVGSAVADNHRVDAPNGVVRAFDARTGRQRWNWDPLLPAADGHRSGAANAWSVMSVDAERDLVFVPVGSASPDFYGGERIGTNLYANSVVALRGSTGAVVWHFQAVHHDLWDYDVPAQPVLVTVRRDGADVPAVVQGTKMGHLFVLHRETGRPLFPVEERTVPKSTVPGEEAWPTQPFPLLPKPIAPSTLTAADAWGPTAADREACRALMTGLRAEGIFTPPSLEGTLVFPGNVGGSNWSGVAYDPVRGLLVAPTNRLATVVRLIPRAELAAARRRYPRAEVAPQDGTPYGMARAFLFSPRGAPCNPPPWGALTAIDLATGAVRWERPLGSVPALAGVPGSDAWGSLNLGGAIATGGGLVFAAGALDERLHAFDVESGRELWSARLPAGGNALPMTYRLRGGRQFVVIAAGGHGRMGTTLGDYVVAFALPGAERPDSAPAAALGGTWAGELILERRRLPLTLTAREDAAGAVSGELRITTPAVTATVAGSRRGDTVTFTAPFTNATERCAGTIRATAALANGGRLFVGEVRITGECSGAEPEVGTFALRRAP